MRIVKLLSYYGKVEVEDVYRISQRSINVPKKELVKIMHELTHHNPIMYNMIKW
jgi:hypothetical protein